jgi:uncharacterized protein (DUF433 family)
MTVEALDPTDIRVTAPLYSTAEAARFLGVPASTFASWAGDSTRRASGGDSDAAVTAISRGRGAPWIPFIGLAEGQVLAAFRRAGVSMQHIRRAIAVLRQEFGLPHALASERLYTDGAVVLYEYAEWERDEEVGHLTQVVSQQRVFREVVEEHLTRISYGSDGWAIGLVSPAVRRHVVGVDLDHAFGRPRFLRGGVPVTDVIDRWRAGEALAEVADDLGVPREDVEDYLRAALPAAA